MFCPSELSRAVGENVVYLQIQNFNQRTYFDHLTVQVIASHALNCLTAIRATPAAATCFLEFDLSRSVGNERGKYELALKTDSNAELDEVISHLEEHTRVNHELITDMNAQIRIQAATDSQMTSIRMPLPQHFASNGNGLMNDADSGESYGLIDASSFMEHTVIQDSYFGSSPTTVSSLGGVKLLEGLSKGISRLNNQPGQRGSLKFGSPKRQSHDFKERSINSRLSSLSWFTIWGGLTTSTSTTLAAELSQGLTIHTVVCVDESAPAKHVVFVGQSEVTFWNMEGGSKLVLPIAQLKRLVIGPFHQYLRATFDTGETSKSLAEITFFVLSSSLASTKALLLALSRNNTMPCGHDTICVHQLHASMAILQWTHLSCFFLVRLRSLSNLSHIPSASSFYALVLFGDAQIHLLKLDVPQLSFTHIISHSLFSLTEVSETDSGRDVVLLFGPDGQQGQSSEQRWEVCPLGMEDCAVMVRAIEECFQLIAK
jgi:hypothetical protein